MPPLDGIDQRVCYEDPKMGKRQEFPCHLA
jgi:hypothetical protein